MTLHQTKCSLSYFVVAVITGKGGKCINNSSNKLTCQCDYSHIYFSCSWLQSIMSWWDCFFCSNDLITQFAQFPLSCGVRILERRNIDAYVYQNEWVSIMYQIKLLLLTDCKNLWSSRIAFSPANNVVTFHKQQWNVL